ncbi:ABC transporter permease [Micromonospora sp. Llam7]|uniref:ABC transporter permease n=1 Tax=Micromonospora tarapacensis TaxID=2835305 RepID=UPI001C838463|nr:ABC transporter permease [Micromonospora tarapacensis]MBX7267391.1 ABC transporter permease [Micromonospora tarapacensis]
MAGGRSGWARLALISAGVGLGVAMLLTATALPTVGAARDDRSTARSPGPEVAAAGPDTLLYAVVRSQYRDVRIEGRLLRPEGDRAPVPPGVERQLAPGEMVVSPALAQLWHGPDGGLLRERWGGQVVGTIAPDGLTGPGEHFFYLGTDQLTTVPYYTQRISAFGASGPAEPAGLPPVLLVLAVLGLVVLLLPVMIFVTTAVRFGSEARDRQLAALRLVGADVTMTRLVAAGETLVGTVLGMLLGALVFLGAGPFVGELVPARFSFFPADLRPVPALVAVVVLLVPAAAVAVTLSALRRVMIEPLGVVRRGVERRRLLWWRLIPPVLGLLLLYPLLGGLPEGGGPIIEAQLTAGLTLLLVGIALLLPWLVPSVVRRLDGGGVAWELAVRRLRLDSDTAVRAVAGIAVSVAGVIAVQGVLGVAQAQFSTPSGPTDRFQATVYATSAADEQLPALPRALADLPGVRVTSGVSYLTDGSDTADPTTVRVGECAALAQYAELGSCVEGDSFAVGGPGGPPAGTLLTFDEQGPGASWTVPENLRRVELHSPLAAAVDYLVTPAALGFVAPAAEIVLVGLDPADPDALERVRNVTARVDPFAAVQSIEDQYNSTLLANVEQAVQVGAVALLLLIGVSMLVNVLEQLRERRRLLAVLTAFGTSRRILSRSVLYQVGIPVVLGLVLAVGAGSVLTAVLLSVVGESVGFNWGATAGVSGAAALMVLAVTAASLPLLWRLTRADGLRSE